MLRTHESIKIGILLKIITPPWFFEQLLLGFNYRMNDIEAVPVQVKLKDWTLFIRRRNKIAKIYNKHLKKFPLILPLKVKNL